MHFMQAEYLYKLKIGLNPQNKKFSVTLAGLGFETSSPFDSQPDSLPNTNIEYRTETKTLYARPPHSFYTIWNETKTNKSFSYQDTPLIFGMHFKL